MNVAASRPRLTLVGWIVLTLFATVIGLFSLRYILPTIPFPARLDNVVTHRQALTVHAVAASVALLIGPWQFFGRLRRRHLTIHRALGRCYVLAVVVGWVASVMVALHAQTGRAAAAGFLVLGLVWITCTGIAVAKIMQRDISAHQSWMIRSYALTAAGITLRIYLVTALALHFPFVVAYPIIAWACWVPNLAGAEIALRMSANGVVRA